MSHFVIITYDGITSINTFLIRLPLYVFSATQEKNVPCLLMQVIRF